MLDYLSEELIVEFFTRLPPKSLLRFRSLSKSLCSCISSTDFIRLHTFQSPQKVIFIHLNKEKGKKETYFQTLHGEDELPLCLCPKRGHIGIKTVFPFFPCSTNSITVGSCNGISCMRTKKGLSLWNPSIRRKLGVPECPRMSELPSEGIGFGFDPISDDYKIVWISYAKDSSFVYGVKTGTWCEISSPKPYFSLVQFEAFLFDGVLHWLVHNNDIESENPYLHPYILTFDLSTHIFGMIPVPGPACRWITTDITTIQGSLALISYRMKFDDTWIRVWRDASWSVVFKLGTGKLPMNHVLQLPPQPTINGDLLLDTYGEGLQVYNSKTGVRSSVVDFNATSEFINFCPCVETLQMLDMGEFACETTK